MEVIDNFLPLGIAKDLESACRKKLVRNNLSDGFTQYKKFI